MGLTINFKIAIDANRNIEHTLERIIANWPRIKKDELIIHPSNDANNYEKISKKEAPARLVPSKGKSPHTSSLAFGTGGGTLYTETDGNYVTVYWMSGIYEDADNTRRNLAEFLEKIIPEVDPAFVLAELVVYGTDDFQYFSDSRYLATNWSEYASDFVLADWASKTSEIPIIKHELNEAKRLMTSKEVNDILKKIVPAYLEHKNGLGVWRFNPKDKLTRENTIGLWSYPAYFIRKELRRRGAKLFFGPAEKALIRDLKYPKDLLKLGVIDERLVKKIEISNTNAINDFDAQDKANLSLLTPEEKHELGLDLPKFEGSE